MNTDAITKQLEKALKEKDDKVMRIRIEVLLDMLKESRAPTFPVIPQPTGQQSVQQPILPRYEEPTRVTSPKVVGSGPIVGGEQLTYKRPKGT